MKEIPIIQHNALLPLPSTTRQSTNGNDDDGGVPKTRHYNVTPANNHGVGGGAIGIIVTNQHTSSTSLVVAALPAHNDLAKHAAAINRDRENAAHHGLEEPTSTCIAQRGLSSMLVGQGDRIICTHAVAGRNGRVVRITTTRGGSSGATTDKEGVTCDDFVDSVEVDLTKLMDEKVNGSSLLEGPFVGTSVVVTDSNAINGTNSEGTMAATTDSALQPATLHLRIVDPYGTVLSLSFSYPCMTPTTQSSFLLPLSPHHHQGTNTPSLLRPHPGALIENNQICFPTPSTVVFALNPHLYCVDLGSAIGNTTAHGTTQPGNTFGTVTRVWTSVHNVTSDPILDSSTDATAGGGTSARKKPRKSMAGMLTQATYSLMGIDDPKVDLYEYGNGDSDDEGKYGRVPSIVVLDSLDITNNDAPTDRGTTARVATLHSDGSLRVWTALPSTLPSLSAQLRIPSVQRIATSRKNGTWATSEYSNPPIPSHTKWDPSRDALTLRGQFTGGGYELALYVQCYNPPIVTNTSNNANDDNGSNVYILQGEIVSASAGNDTSSLPAGDMAKMQTLKLPNGTKSVVDVGWSASRDLMVLLRHSTNSNGDSTDLATETLYDMGENTKVSMAIYPLENQSGNYHYASVATLPFNTTLAYLGLNNFSHVQKSSEEELDRYLHLGIAKNEGTEMDDLLAAGDATTTADAIAKMERQVDRAGLLAIMQPFGRSRPSALAVRHAMAHLGLLDNDDSFGSLDNDGRGVRPVDVLSAMHKWKKRAAFQSPLGFSSSSALVIVDEHDGNTGGGEGVMGSPMTSNSLDIYHAFASGTKAFTKNNASREQRDSGSADYSKKQIKANSADAAQQAHKWRWIQLLSEIRLRENQLDEVLCFGRGMSMNVSFLVRGSMLSVLTLTDEKEDLKGVSVLSKENMAALDNLSMSLLQHASSNPNLRPLLSQLESTLYHSTCQASSLTQGWATTLENVQLPSEVEKLGSMVLDDMMSTLTEGQLGLLGELGRLDTNFVEKWLKMPVSACVSVNASLALSNSMPNSIIAANPLNQQTRVGESTSAIASSAASLVAAKLESIRFLSLSRLILVFGAPQGNPPRIQQDALRSILYSTALSWAIQQPSTSVGRGKGLTVLEEHLSEELSKSDLGMTGALSLADRVVASAFDVNGSGLSDIVSPSKEPQVALRLLAPLVEFPSQSSAQGPSTPAGFMVDQKRRQVTAECLLAEAAILASKKCANSSTAVDTSPESLWRLASSLLLDISPMESSATGITISNLVNRVGTLERHLSSMIEGGSSNIASLSLCCGVILDAIQDVIAAISSNNNSQDISSLCMMWEVAFQTSMRGHLWDEALHTCVSHPASDQRKANLKGLILEMVDAGALGKIVDMSLTVMDRDLTMQEDGQESDVGGMGIDLFELASKIIEEAAVEQVTTPLESDADRPNYWGCLYALHASRGNWGQAAYAMDMCGKATADSVSSCKKSDSEIPTVLSKAASRIVMDDACLSAQACFHAISLVDNSSHQYLLPGNENIPSESRLFTKEDLERRAARALALRTFSMDDYSPDSVGSILELTSRDTIDSLARFGYYDQAISVAEGVSSKRKALPGGVDLFDDAMMYILCTYLVPAATKSGATSVDDDLQSRSKIAQIHTSSSACALGSALPQSCITSFSANSKSLVSNGQSSSILQSTMSMDLLQQYTTVYSKRCNGLVLSVADAILRVGESVSELPLWLKDLCMFGIPGSDGSNNNLFAQSSDKDAGIANPPSLMRLYIKHHQYGEACDVVTSILSKQAPQSSNASSRLPEDGSIDYVPYDLIDMLWNMIDSVIASNASNSSEVVKSQVKSLVKRRTCMEHALDRHFALLKTSEEGLVSARRLSRA